MNTLKTLGGALLVIVVKMASDILASLVTSGLFLLNIPEHICIAVMGILYLVIAMVLVKLIYGKAFKLDLKESGVTKLSVKPAFLILAMVLPLVICGIYLLCVKGTFAMPGTGNEKMLSVLAEGIFYNSIAAAVVEEVLFRGVLMNLLMKRWNRYVAVIVPSVVFGLVHIMGMEEFNLTDCIQLVIAGTLAGIMFSVIALRTGSVWNSAIVHLIWNLVMVGGIFSIGNPASETALMTYTLDSRSFLLTGGAFGIESSVVAIAAYVIVAAAVLMTCKKTAKKAVNQ